MSDLTLGPGSGHFNTPIQDGAGSFPVAGVDPVTGDPVSIDPGMPVAPTAPPTTIYAARSDSGAAAANVMGIAISAGEKPGRAKVFFGPGPVTLTEAQWKTVNGGAALVPGDVYYLSATAGEITSTMPVSGFVTSIGFALSTTTMFVQISAALELH